MFSLFVMLFEASSFDYSLTLDSHHISRSTLFDGSLSCFMTISFAMLLTSMAADFVRSLSLFE